MQAATTNNTLSCIYGPLVMCILLFGLKQYTELIKAYISFLQSGEVNSLAHILHVLTGLALKAVHLLLSRHGAGVCVWQDCSTAAQHQRQGNQNCKCALHDSRFRDQELGKKRSGLDSLMELVLWADY